MLNEDTKRSLLQFLEERLSPDDLDDFRRMLDTVDTSAGTATAAMDSATMRRRVAEAVTRTAVLSQFRKWPRSVPEAGTASCR